MVYQIGGMRPWEDPEDPRRRVGPRPISGFDGQFSGSTPTLTRPSLLPARRDGADLSESERRALENAADRLLASATGGEMVTPQDLRRLDRAPARAIEGDPTVEASNPKAGRPWAPYGGTIEVPYREMGGNWTTRRLDPAAIASVIAGEARFEPDATGGFTRVGGPTSTRGGRYVGAAPAVVASSGRVLANPDDTASWKTTYQQPLSELVQQAMGDYMTPWVDAGIAADPGRFRPADPVSGTPAMVRVLTAAQEPNTVANLSSMAGQRPPGAPAGREGATGRAPFIGSQTPRKRMQEAWVEAFPVTTRDGREGFRLGSKLPRQDGLWDEISRGASLGGLPIAGEIPFDETVAVDVIQRARRSNNRIDEAGRSRIVAVPQLQAARQLGWQFDQPDRFGVIRGRRDDQSEFVLVPETVLGRGDANTGTPTGRYILRTPEDFASAGIRGFGVAPLSPHAGTRKQGENVDALFPGMPVERRAAIVAKPYELLQAIQSQIGAEPEPAPPLAVGRALQRALTTQDGASQVIPSAVTGGSATQLEYVQQLLADAAARPEPETVVQLPLPQATSTRTGRAIDWIRKAGLRRGTPFAAAPEEVAAVSAIRPGLDGAAVPVAPGQMELPGVIPRGSLFLGDDAIAAGVNRMNSEAEFWAGVSDVDGSAEGYNVGYRVVRPEEAFAGAGTPELNPDVELLSRVAQRQLGIRDPFQAEYLAQQAMLNGAERARTEGRNPSISDNVRALWDLSAAPVRTTRLDWPEGAVAPAAVPVRPSVLMPVSRPGERITEVGVGMEPTLVQGASPREAMPRTWRAPLVRGARAIPPLY
jgi:hypothetical protein